MKPTCPRCQAGVHRCVPGYCGCPICAKPRKSPTARKPQRARDPRGETAPGSQTYTASAGNTTAQRLLTNNGIASEVLAILESLRP